MESYFLEEVKSRIINTKRDTRYSVQAYDFFALTKGFLEKVYKETNAEDFNFSAYDIVKSSVRVSVFLYGPIAQYVLADMGIFSAKDIGNIIFNLIDLGILNRRMLFGRYEDFVELSRKRLFGKVLPRPLNMEFLKIFDDT